MKQAALAAESGRFWTWSNMVSMFRLVLTVPVVYALMTDHNMWAFWLCWFAAFTDWLDGRIARATNTVSEWGKVIDPIADKVLVGAIVVVMVQKGLLPLAFVVAVVVRDIVIVVAAWILRRYTPVVQPSLMSGKLAVTAIALTGVFAIAGWKTAVDVGIYVSLAIMAVSLWQYGGRFYGIVRQNQENLQ